MEEIYILMNNEDGYKYPVAAFKTSKDAKVYAAYCGYDNDSTDIEEIDYYSSLGSEYDYIKEQLKHTFTFCYVRDINTREWDFKRYGKSYDSDEMMIYTIRYKYYCSKYLRSNRLMFRNYYDSLHESRSILIEVNIVDDNKDEAIKVAKDIMDQFLSTCNNEPTQNDINVFNCILSKDEDTRKKLIEQEKKKSAEDKLREKELKELKRLKEKYEKSS